MKSTRIIGALLLVVVGLAVVSAFVHDGMMQRRVAMWRALAQQDTVANLSVRLTAVKQMVSPSPVGGGGITAYVIPGPIEWGRLVQWDWPPVRIPERQKIVVVTNHALTSVDGVVLVGATITQVAPIQTEFDTGYGRVKLMMSFGKDASGELTANAEIISSSEPVVITGSPPQE